MISRDSGGVRRSALDMFYVMDDIFDFRRKNNFSIFFFVEKKSDEKNIYIFFVNVGQLDNVRKKKSRYFFIRFFDEKFSKKYFFFKNQKYHP